MTVEVESIRLNGGDVDPAAADGVRIALPPLAAENELTVVATMRYSRSGEGLHRFVDPADAQVYLYTQLATTDARRVFPCFEQPDLKGRFALEVTAPDGWDVRSNQPVSAQEPVGDGARWWRFEPHEAALHLPRRAHRRRVGRAHRLADRLRRPHDPARGADPRLPRALHRPGGGLRDHEGRLRLLRGRVRDPVPVREVRPGDGARVQLGRHGEPGPRHLQRGLRLPLHADRRAAGGARDGRAARAGAHVVRRPGDDAVVGRHSG